MANIVLGIVGDTTDIYKKIGDLETYAKNMKPIELKFKAVGFNEVSKNALALARVQAQVEISANKAAEAEQKARVASLAYGKQAETTRTQEARRRAETERTRKAVIDLCTQTEKTRTENQRYATQTEKTRTAEQNRLAATEKTRAALANLRGEQERTVSSSSNLANSIHAIGDAYAKLWSRITSTITRRLINQAFTALRTTIKDTLDVMKEVDTQLINIQKVSGKTSEEIAAIGERAYDTAAKYGVAVEDYLSAVYSFQKAGLGESAESLAELATKTMLVGDTTAAVAEKFLISSNAAWELHGNIDELNKVIDQADYINNNYATTLDKIAAGLPIVASVAANAGMTYSETMAALGTIQSITQESGTKSATALRALILNIEKEAGTYLTEEGEEFEVTAESIKGLEGLLRKYAAAEMEAAEASGELLNPMTAIKALFEGMKNSDVTDIELFQLLSSMGGKLRTNQLTALVKNFDMFDEMLQRIGNSAGTADNEVQLMMQSWEKKSQVLKDRWQQFIAQLVSTDEIKGFIDDITEFVTNLDAKEIAAAFKDIFGPIIDFIKNVDWAGAAQGMSDIFDKILRVAKGTAIAATIGAIIGGLEKVVKLLGAVGGILGVGGIAGVAVGGGILGAIGLITAAVVNYRNKTRTYRESTEALRDIQSTIDETKKEYEDTTRSVEATNLVVQRYIDTLKNLEKQGNLTDEQHKEYHDTLVKLATVMPEFSDIIDTENDKIEGGTAALEKNTEAWYENAKAQAYTTMVGAQYDALAKAEIERQRNEIAKQQAESIIQATEDKAEELRRAFEEKWSSFEDPISGLFNGSQQEWEQREADRAAIDALFSSAEYLKAQQEVAQLQAAIDDYDAEIEERKKEIEEINAAWEAIEAERAQAQEAAQAEEQRQDRMNKRAEARRNQFGVTREATQAEEEYAEAAEASGEAGQEAAVLTATAVREDTVPALKEVKEALDAIPEERGITLTPHFENALAAIERYCHFLDYLKENYSSTLTSTITHDDREHGKFTQETFSGANGIPARAVGDSNFPGGPTLVNELGPELISENGRAFIAGGGKPTVVNLAPGAIVIPADQTREALKGGMPRYGRAGIFVGGFTNQSGNPSISGVDTNLGIRVTTSNKSGKGGGKGSGKGGSGSSGSASATVTFDFKGLESALSDALKLYDAQAKLAENEGDYAKMAEMYEKSQEAIKDLVDKYRQAGYADDSIEIVTLLNKNYDYAKKQLDIYDDKWDELIAALEADTDATKAAAELEEKRLALEEAVAAYENAQKQRTVRMYNAATGQWEWIADNKQIQSAREKVTSAEENYNSAVKKQAIEELKKMKENVSDLSDVVLGPALSAVVTMSESTEEFQNFARALNAVFGVGSFLQSTEGTTKALSTVDSHDTHYSFGGVDITPEQAGSMTLKQLAEMLQVLKLT